jgi:hypothetical protein
MMRQKTAWITGACIVAMATACFAKVPTLTGKMVAYDPLLHAAKDATFVANKEIVILEVAGQKTRYVKVVFVGFGTTQIDPKYFDGSLPLSVKAIRDHACEDTSPKLVPQLGPDQATGTYLLTDAFKNSPPGKIKKIECYDATGKK